MLKVMLLNIALVFVAFTVIVLGWTAVHLLARGRLGERKFSCKGPQVDEKGVAWCCKGDGTQCTSDDHPQPRIRSSA